MHQKNDGAKWQRPTAIWN